MIHQQLPVTQPGSPACLPACLPSFSPHLGYQVLLPRNDVARVGEESMVAALCCAALRCCICGGLWCTPPSPPLPSDNFATFTTLPGAAVPLVPHFGTSESRLGQVSGLPSSGRPTSRLRTSTARRGTLPECSLGNHAQVKCPTAPPQARLVVVVQQGGAGTHHRVNTHAQEVARTRQVFLRAREAKWLEWRSTLSHITLTQHWRSVRMPPGAAPPRPARPALNRRQRLNRCLHRMEGSVSSSCRTHVRRLQQQVVPPRAKAVREAIQDGRR
ncbi:hypothetical protein E2C01_058063 [Portunus trituberculatus]|uniref:Uncharacterized protein n=1 Tax=Portunus trituberculatus TaxID=210409 RepID=A0A5B7H2R5_PORTR|nr:hypothetical protein [Portunus trituberculatus]